MPSNRSRMPIKILPLEVASQIAAGEVVERPASVVKELIENALDAGATHISISIEEAGRHLIEVSDNGEGISSDELPLTISRHATSKLDNAEDLFRITTLGFRGEALASIASVSRFTITSRSASAKQGARIQVDAGKPSKLESVGAPQGTVVRVQDLFYNVPARLEFLKKDVTERRWITLLITRYALAYPQVRFHFSAEGKPKIQTSGDGDRRAILADMYSPDIARSMLLVNAHYGDFKVGGFCSPINLTRASRREIVFFANGRWVQDAAMSAAVVQAYHTMLMVGRYPISVLFVEIPPDQVDVNVHPAKTEVRFRHPGVVFSGVRRAVRSALLANTPIPEVDPQIRWQASPATDTSIEFGMPHWGAESPADKSSSTLEEPDNLDQTDGGGLPFAADAIPLLRLVGQIGSAYLVAEGPDGLYLVDQHAAHERILFEKFVAQSQSDIPSQALLETVTVEFPPSSVELITSQLPVINKLGFQIEAFGPNAFKIRAIPSLLLGSDPTAALQVLVEDFEEDESPLKDEIEKKIIARVCKRAAVKAGQILSLDEQKALLADLELCISPRTCPHGRPTMIHLSIDLLERQFGRKGAR